MTLEVYVRDLVTGINESALATGDARCGHRKALRAIRRVLDNGSSVEACAHRPPLVLWTDGRKSKLIPSRREISNEYLDRSPHACKRLTQERAPPPGLCVMPSPPTLGMVSSASALELPQPVPLKWSAGEGLILGSPEFQEDVRETLDAWDGACKPFSPANSQPICARACVPATF